MAKEWSQEDAERLYELTKTANLKAIKDLVENEYSNTLPENSWCFSLGQLWDCCLNGCDVDVYRYLTSLGMSWDNVRKNKIDNSWGELHDSLIDCCIVENKEKSTDAIKVFLLVILESGYRFTGSSVISGLDETFELFGDDLEVLSALDKAKVPLCPEAYDPGTYGRISYVAFWNRLLDRGLNDTVTFLVRRGYHLPDEISDDPRVAQFKSVEVDEDRRPRDLAEDVRDAKATMALDELKRKGLLSSSDELKDGELLLDERGIAVVPNGVRALEEGAFAHNNKLKVIVVPSSLKRIAKGALLDLSKLAAVSTYDSSPSDAKFESGVFWTPSLEGVEDWPWVLDGIDEYRFGPSLEDVVVSEAQGGLFQTKRPAVTVAEGGTFSSLDGMLMDECGKRLVYCPNENKLSPLASGFSIPEGVEEIYEGALKAAPFSEIAIPSSVRKIGKSAFARMPLQSVSVPGTVEQFDESHEDDWTDDGQGIFSFCEAMQSASLGEGITRVPDAMFYGCNGLLECSLPSTLKSIGNDSFKNCRNLELVVPDACTDIHPKAFGSGILSSVRSVSLSERVSEETLAAICSNANGALVMQRDGAGGYKNLIYLPDDNDDAEARPVLEALWETWGDGFAAGIKGQDEFFASGRLKRFYTKIRIAICRLASPYLLSDDAKKMYSDYLASGIDKAKRELDCYEGAAFLRLLGLINGYDAVEPSVSGSGVAESTGWHFHYYESIISDDHERLDEIGLDTESFENAVRDAVWSMPITIDVEGTKYLDRIEHIESIRPGDPVVLASNWASPYGEACDIEVFDTRGRTLGLLGYCEHIYNPVLALMLPYTSAHVSSVTPLSARRKNARNALLSIEIEVEDGLCDEVEEKAKPEVLIQLEALLDLPNEELVLLSKGNLKAADLKGAVDTSQAIDELPEPTRRSQEVQAMPTFAETDLSEGEPRYRDADGNFNGEALLWLLAEDYVFFNETDFGWNGENNVVGGAQVNSPKKDEIPEFMSELSENATALVMLMRTLENDKQLRVDRGSIHSALYGAIRDGDLTATTLINLVACSRAWRILVPSAVRDLEERGILPNVGGLAPGRVYTVNVDDRLARGIPNFYRLIARLLWDMRKVNGDLSPFRVRFLTTKVLDYNPDLEQFDGSVDGAEVQPFTYIDVNEEPKVKFDLFDLLNAFAGEMGEAEEAPNDPKALKPTGTIADADEAKFTVAVPSGYKCVYNFASPMGEKPFALLPEDMPDEPEDGVQGHVAFQYVAMPDLGDEEMKSARETMFTPDLCIAFQRMMSCQQEAHLTSLQDRVVDGANCRCLVVLEKMELFGAIYNVKIQVAQYDIHDYLRVDCAGMSLERAESVFELACQLAAMISAKDPKECQVLRDAQALLEKKVDGDEFERTFEALSTPLIKARQLEVNSAHTNFCAIHDVYTTKEEVFAQGEALQRWAEENTSYMELCYDAYQAQERLGASLAERKKMYAYLDEFAQHYHLNLGHEGDEWDVKAKAAGVLYVPEKIAELEKMWKSNPLVGAVEGKEELLFAFEGQPVVSGGFTISKKGASREAPDTRGSQSEESLTVLRTAREEAEQAKREAEERAERERKEAEEKARREEEGRVERERKEAEERAEHERLEAVVKSIVAEHVKGLSALVHVVRIDSETLDSEIREAEKTLAESKSANSKCESLRAKVESEVKALSDLRAELKGLGLFAFGRKKELAADIEKREASLRQLQTELRGWQNLLERYGLPGDAKGAVDKLVKRKEDALAVEERARFNQSSAPELVTVKTDQIAEELVDEDENEVGFSYIGADGVKRECYYAEDEDARRERRGFSDSDLVDPKVLGMLGKKYSSVFAKLELDPIVGPIIQANEELRKYTAEGRRAQEAEKEARATSAAARENERLAKEVLMWMPEDRPVLTSEIMEHISGIMTSQKCTKVMDYLIEAGKVERVEKVKGRYIGYRILDNGEVGLMSHSVSGDRVSDPNASGSMMPFVDVDSCIGCGICEDACQQDVLRVAGRTAKVIKPENCTGCEECSNQCPMSAIRVLLKDSSAARDAESANSAKEIENARLAEKVLRVMPSDEPVLTSWIIEHVNGITTSQRCTNVMNVLIEAGKVERVDGVRGRYIGYRLQQRRSSGYGGRTSEGLSSWSSSSNSVTRSSLSSSNTGTYSGNLSSNMNSASAVGDRAAKENEKLAKEVLMWMPSDRPVLTSEIMEHVSGIMTSQKCTKVMNVLIEAGKVEKVEGVRGRYIGYQLL
ncbi:MAG: leucine-rich repeat protein [Eggerthellaceae bacterium]|nr:leucine-rich repeat protein [Eggerthellaceae bacterium]